MSSALRLAALRLRRHPGTSFVLVFCLALTIGLPWTTRALLQDYRAQLLQRAEATPLVLGERGYHFDVALTALYFRQGRAEPLPFGEVTALRQQARGAVVPLNVRFTAQGAPLVATSTDYFPLRGLTAAQGELPLFAGEVVLGAELAAQHQIGVGDYWFSDVAELYDLTLPPAIKLRVVGVLARNQSPDDGAAFVDLSTAWVLEGMSHGHTDAEQVEPEYVLGADDSGVVLSGALLSAQEITPENLSSFHAHGDEATFPISAILFWPASEKEGVLLRTKINQQGDYRMLRPVEVVEELLSYVLQVRKLVDLLSWVLGSVTLLLSALVYLLSSRLRQAEFRTLRRMGSPRAFIAQLLAFELLIVVLLAVALAAAWVNWAAASWGDLGRLLLG